MNYKDHEHFVEMAKVQHYVNSMAFDVFIDEDIDNPEYYRSVINTFNKANEGDTVNIFINTGGGQDRTTSSIISAMDNSKANIVGHLSGSVCSNGTIIALHCHQWNLAEDLIFMCHNGIAGFHGSAEKVKKRHDFYQEQNRKVIFREYEGFLSDSECEEIIVHGEEFWFDKEETQSRLEKFVEYHQNKHSQALEQHFEAEMAEEDKYLDAAIHILKEEGELSEEEATRLKVISDKIDSLFSERKDDVENIFKSLSEDSVEDKSLSTFKAEPIQEDEYNSVMIWDRDDNEYGILSWKDGEGIEFELLDEDETLYQINQVFLEDLPKKELKQLSKDLGIKYSHNSKDETLAKNLVKFFEEIVNE